MKREKLVRSLLVFLAFGAMTVAPSLAWAETDENGLTPHSWFTFDELSEGTITDGTTAANKGSGATMTLPAGSVVSTGSGTDKAWQFGTAAKDTGAIDGSNLRPVTYITRLNLNGKSFSGDKVIWGSNGQLYGGPCLTVTGSGTSYTVAFGRHDNGSVKAKYVEYAVPSELVSGFHWYVMTISDTGTTVTCYVDGQEVGSSDSATYTATANGLLGWGRLGNAGDSPAEGLQVSEFRFYKTILTEAQIKKICGGTRETWGNAGTTTEKGIATKLNGGSYTSFTIDFNAVDNISQTGIESHSFACIQKIRLFRRQGKTDAAPATITLSQSGVSDVVSTSVSLVTGQKLYGESWPTTKSAYWTLDVFEAIFDSETVFDTTQPLTITFPAAQLCMIQPANSVMSNNQWSPAIEITASCTDPGTYVATVDGNTKWSEIVWSPEKPTKGFLKTSSLIITNTAAATVTFDEDVDVASVKIVNKSGAAFGFAYESSCTAQSATWDFTETAGGISFASVDVTEAAMRAVAGAPYSYWVLPGTILGTPSVVCPTTSVQTGYSVASGVIADKGVRLIVSATTAQYGSININFMGNKSEASSDDNAKVSTKTGAVGGCPVVGTRWNDLEGKNQTDTRIYKYVTSDQSFVSDANITLTASQVHNAYGSGAAKNMLITGYLDDGSNPIVQVGKIPFSNYRVIVYRATDSSGMTFSAAQIGTTASDTKIYYGPTTSVTTAGVTLTGSTETAWGKSDYRDDYIEGVNYIVSDVLSGTAGEATAYVYSHKHAGRAGVAAVQIVEVFDAFTTTLTTDKEFSSILSWLPFKPKNGFTASNKIRVTNTAASQLKFDQDLTCQSFAFINAAGKPLTVAFVKDVSLTAGTWNFSAAAGTVAFDCSALTGDTAVTLMTGSFAGLENLDTAGSILPPNTKLVVLSDAIRLVPTTFTLTWTNAEGDNDITKDANWTGGTSPYSSGVLTADFALAADADWSSVTFATQDNRVIDLAGHILTIKSLDSNFGTCTVTDNSRPKVGELVFSADTTTLWDGLIVEDGVAVRVANGATLAANGRTAFNFKLILENTSVLTATAGSVTLTGGLQLDLSKGSGAYTLPTTAGLVDGSSVMVGLAGRADLVDGMKVVSWTAAPSETVSFFASGVAFVLERKTDGLYLKAVEGLVIGVR